MGEFLRITAGIAFIVSSMVTIGYLLVCNFDAVRGPAIAMFVSFCMLLIGQAFED